MNQSERLNDLLELVTQRGWVGVEEASRALAVSTATIRRDFDHLARQQLIHRARGGASPVVGYELPLSYKATRHATEKQRIAAAASALVQPGQVVGINGGTTAAEVSRALASRPDIAQRDGSPRLTVVTNAVNIAAELTVRPYIKLVMTGGIARPQSYELTGPLARQTLTRLRLDVAFLGADGVDVAGGITAQHEGEAEVNGLLAARARSVVVVADSSKLGRSAFALICRLSAVNVLVTDAGAPEHAVRAVEEAGVRVERV
ncbi:DeoR/GlpR transcriptional regulator [Motilibacter sp. E257]|uniref:DeoR/GlpR transcriptional regulator n=1 Tax=Motilibacter deserti TaxID=2714956 RepID=A0ABX0GXM2_9ACTN|nr:DeoR/GlpR transcriptional regulator [Motilibacter deserti]